MDDTVLGKTDLGEKGVTAEKIGERVATEMIKEIVSGATIDIHAFDQLIPYMALTDRKRSSCIVREISNHALTNMWLVGKFFGDEDIFNIDTKKGLKIINVHGQS